MKTLNEQTLMPCDWLQRRLSRMISKGQKGGPFRPTTTLNDVAHWFNVDSSFMFHLENGRRPITDKWQVQLSQFFYLLDMGLIELKVDLRNRKKTWVRSTPVAPPCKAPMPRVDFFAAKLKFD